MAAPQGCSSGQGLPQHGILPPTCIPRHDESGTLSCGGQASAGPSAAWPLLDPAGESQRGLVTLSHPRITRLRLSSSGSPTRTLATFLSQGPSTPSFFRSPTTRALPDNVWPGPGPGLNSSARQLEVSLIVPPPRLRMGSHVPLAPGTLLHLYSSAVEGCKIEQPAILQILGEWPWRWRGM